jgi:hypothetical protein
LAGQDWLVEEAQNPFADFLDERFDLFLAGRRRRVEHAAFAVNVRGEDTGCSKVSRCSALVAADEPTVDEDTGVAIRAAEFGPEAPAGVASGQREGAAVPGDAVGREVTRPPDCWDTGRVWTGGCLSWRCGDAAGQDLAHGGEQG